MIFIELELDKENQQQQLQQLNEMDSIIYVLWL